MSQPCGASDSPDSAQFFTLLDMTTLTCQSSCLALRDENINDSDLLKYHFTYVQCSVDAKWQETNKVQRIYICYIYQYQANMTKKQIKKYIVVMFK